MAEKSVLLPLLTREVMFICWKQFGEKRDLCNAPQRVTQLLTFFFRLVPSDVKPVKSSQIPPPPDFQIL